MSKQQAWILIVIAAVAVGALVQMNRYEYLEERIGNSPPHILRIDRLTDQVCVTSVPLTWRSKPEGFANIIDTPLC